MDGAKLACLEAGLEEQESIERRVFGIGAGTLYGVGIITSLGMQVGVRKGTDGAAITRLPR